MNKLFLALALTAGMGLMLGSSAMAESPHKHHKVHHRHHRHHKTHHVGNP